MDITCLVKKNWFLYLNNGIDRRKCLISEVLKFNGDTFGIIEVQREGKSLSTLILMGKLNEQRQLIYQKLLNGLVHESGKWSNEVIEGLRKEKIVIHRKKHSRKNLENIFESIK